VKIIGLKERIKTENKGTTKLLFQKTYFGNVWITKEIVLPDLWFRYCERKVYTLYYSTELRESQKLALVFIMPKKIWGEKSKRQDLRDNVNIGAELGQ